MSERLLTVRCTAAQYDLWQAVAGHRGLSRWVKERLDIAAAQAVEPEPEPVAELVTAGGPARCYHGLTDCAICDY